MTLNDSEFLVIDSHVHVYALDTKRFPRKPVMTPPPPEPAEIEDFIQIMKTQRVERAVLVQPSYYGEDNRYILHCLNEYPELLRAIVIASYNHEEGRKFLEEAFANPLVCGARFNIIGEDDPTAWAKKANLHNLLKVIEEAGKIAVLHLEYRHLRKICEIADSYRNVSFVIDHMGYPIPGEVSLKDYRQLFKMIGGYPNIFIKISGMEMRSKDGYPFTDMVGYVGILKEMFFPSKLLWASNYPYVLNATVYVDMRMWLQWYIPYLTDEEIVKIFHDNAFDLFWKDNR